MDSINEGEFVYVPCNCAPEFNSCHEALVRAEVLNIEGETIKVNIGEGTETQAIDISKVHKNPSILILCLGDIVSESQNLDPLAKSILHYCRLFHRDGGQVKYYKTRSIDDLKDIWNEYGKTFSIIIFISHGCTEGFTFGLKHVCISAKELKSVFTLDEEQNKLFISLSCQTGCGDFGSAISNTKFCKEFIGPDSNIHSALASQFCQTFLANYLMDGSNIIESFKKAKKAIPGTMSFNLFLDGEKYVEKIAPIYTPSFERHHCTECGCLGEFDVNCSDNGTVIKCSSCQKYYCHGCIDGIPACKACMVC